MLAQTTTSALQRTSHCAEDLGSICNRVYALKSLTSLYATSQQKNNEMSGQEEKEANKHPPTHGWSQLENMRRVEEAEARRPVAEPYTVPEGYKAPSMKELWQHVRISVNAVIPSCVGPHSFTSIIGPCQQWHAL